MRSIVSRNMTRLALLGVLAALCLALALWLTRPHAQDATALQGLVGDLDRGQAVFNAAGCASCHMAKGATGPARLVLSGGQIFASPFGDFTAPNISPDAEQGIGGWSALDLLNAMRHGTSPSGQHYYPVFPYGSYNKITAQAVVDLHAYLNTLAPSSKPNQPHGIGFPFNIRAGLGLWKAMFLRTDWVLQTNDPELAHGRYLVEAMGHCAECHTPRGILGQLQRDKWLAGAPNPAGRGSFPDITPGTLNWSADEIFDYLTTGFTPDFDVAGGHMALVVDNLAQLPEGDVRAIVAYLQATDAQ